jgi:hypothetical protein
MIDDFYRTPILRILGSLRITAIVLLDSSHEISRDPCIEGIIGTTEDVGKIANRKEEIGDRWDAERPILR